MAHPDDDVPKAGPPRAGGERLSAGETIAPSPGAMPPRGADPGLISGSVLDHFEILERIGSGGFGDVYRARDTRLGVKTQEVVHPG